MVNIRLNYQITVLSETCTDVACQLRCIDCSVCCHAYHCTCPDFLLKSISCKHIHLLRRQQHRVNSSQSDKQDEDEKEEQHVTDDNIKDSQVYLNNEITSSFSTLVSEKKGTKVDTLKDKLKDTLTSLTKEIEECGNQDLDAIKHLDKQISAAIITFQSLRQYKPVYTLQATRFVPFNKNIEVQKNFYSTKKRRKQKNNVRFAKPSVEEKAVLL